MLENKYINLKKNYNVITYKIIKEEHKLIFFDPKKLDIISIYMMIFFLES